MRNILDPRQGGLNPFAPGMQPAQTDCPQPGELTDSTESDDNADDGYANTEKDCNE